MKLQVLSPSEVDSVQFVSFLEAMPSEFSRRSGSVSSSPEQVVFPITLWAELWLARPRAAGLHARVAALSVAFSQWPIVVEKFPARNMNQQ